MIQYDVYKLVKILSKLLKKHIKLKLTGKLIMMFLMKINPVI